MQRVPGSLGVGQAAEGARRWAEGQDPHGRGEFAGLRFWALGPSKVRGVLAPSDK